MKIKPEDLNKIAASMKNKMLLRSGAESVKIVVHMGTCGIASGARKILKALQDTKEDLQANDVLITTSGCAGLCSQEPMITIHIKNSSPVKYTKLTKDKVTRIFQEHILNGTIVKDLVFAQGNERVL